MRTRRREPCFFFRCNEPNARDLVPMKIMRDLGPIELLIIEGLIEGSSSHAFRSLQNGGTKTPTSAVSVSGPDAPIMLATP